MSIVLIIIFVVYRFGFFVVFMLFGNERKIPPTPEQLVFSQREKTLHNSLKNELKCDKVSGYIDIGNVYSLYITYEQCDSLNNDNKIENRNIVISRQLKNKIFNNDTSIIKTYEITWSCYNNNSKRYLIRTSEL